MKIWPWSVIADLREDNAYLKQELIVAHSGRELAVKEWRDQRNKIEYLVRTIRDIDEQIFKMSQLSSWEDMRPHFTDLNEGMITRKRTESDRISEVLRPELIKAYSAQTNSDLPALRGPDAL